MNEIPTQASWLPWALLSAVFAALTAICAQVGLEGERWSFTLWGRNVFDERYASSVYMRSISPAIYGRLDIDAMQNEPGATYGAEFRWRF